MKPTKSTLSLIIDTIFATWIVALVVATALRSIASLITEPDRPLLPIMLDWLIIAVFVIAVVVTALLTRRVLANAKIEEAAEQQKRATHGITGHGTTTRKMTPDELEGAGLPRDFHSTP